MTTTYFRIYHPKSNSWDSQSFQNEEDAVKHAASKTFTKGEVNEYWTNQNNVVEKVTTTIETVKIITPEEKI